MYARRLRIRQVQLGSAPCAVHPKHSEEGRAAIESADRSLRVCSFLERGGMERNGYILAERNRSILVFGLDKNLSWNRSILVFCFGMA